jgi:hypothetical protein
LYIGLFSENSMNKLPVYGVYALSLALIGCGGSAFAPQLTAPNPSPNPSPNPTQPTLISQAISFNIGKLVVGTTDLGATADSGLPVTLVSQNPSICTVSGASITGVALGACTVTASQAGNVSYSAAPEVTATIYVVDSQSINPVVIPALSVGMRAVLNPTATSNRPVVLVSSTPATCVIEDNMIVRALMPGACNLFALQSSFASSKYADAPSIPVSTTVVAANTTLTPNAVLAPWRPTTPTNPSIPQIGSTAQDPTTTTEGIYTDTSNGVGLIDSANNIQYYGNGLLVSGSINKSASTWILNNSAVSVPPPPTAGITANGTFTPKQSFIATAQSFFPKPLSLVYSVDNGFAASQSDLTGNWLYNDGAFRYDLAVDASGAITGTVSSFLDTPCTLTGSVQLATPSSQHNLYRMSLTTGGSSCYLGLNVTYTGLAALTFLAAGNNASNGYLRSLNVVANNSAIASSLVVKLFRIP